MKILLFGKRGQIGWELQRSLAVLGTLTALDLDSTELHADFRRPEALVETIRMVRPNVIVNAAGYTEVDRAEREPELAHTINAEAPRVLAEEAAALGALMVHYSTDYVFEGSGTAAHDESAPTGPLSVYGRAMLAGEAAICASSCAHLILRTSWVYSSRGSNFVHTILKLASEQTELRVVNDQVGAPTGADLVADVTAHAIREVRANRAPVGTYHCVAFGETSWHAYAQFVIEWARARGLPLKVTPDAVHAVRAAEYSTPARRPLNSRMDTRKLRAAFHLTLPDWQSGVLHMLEEVYGR